MRMYPGVPTVAGSPPRNLPMYSTRFTPPEGSNQRVTSSTQGCTCCPSHQPPLPYTQVPCSLGWAPCAALSAHPEPVPALVKLTKRSRPAAAGSLLSVYTRMAPSRAAVAAGRRPPACCTHCSRLSLRRPWQQRSKQGAISKCSCLMACSCRALAGWTAPNGARIKSATGGCSGPDLPKQQRASASSSGLDANF
jgi:hypothetical protein